MTGGWRAATVAAALLWPLARPTLVAGQQHAAAVRATAHVLAPGFVVTPEVVAAIVDGWREGCLATRQPCAPRPHAVAELRTPLATVRTRAACDVRKSACRPVVMVQFLAN